MVLAVVLAAVLIVVGGVAVALRLSDRTSVELAPSTPVTASPSVPAPVGPDVAAGSDVFDGWGVNGTGSTEFQSTPDAHSGGEALLVHRPADGSADPASIAQTVSVAQRSVIVVSFWASSAGPSVDGAVRLTVGQSAPAQLSLPGAPFDWTRFSVRWNVPAGVDTATLAVVSTGPAAEVRIDDVAVQGQGSRGVVVQNGAFETSSAAVRITDPSLVLRRSDTLHLASRLAPEGTFGWELREFTGGRPLSGRGRFEEGEASVPLAKVPPGYYSLTVRLRVGEESIERSTDLVVTTAPPEGTSAPILAVGVHLGAETDAQLAQKVADLAALGLRAARTDADWASIEKAPGQFDFSYLDRIVAALQLKDLRPLLIPDYRNPLYDDGRTPSSPTGIAAYARFAAAVAQRYPDADIEVYNEFDFRFNNGACGTTPECYLRLLGPTASALRASGTRGTVVGPGIAGIGVQQDWLQGFIDGGGLGSVGALSFHPYVQPERPDVLDEELAALRASMSAAGGGAMPIWFTEFGDATVPGWVSEEQQAEDLARVVGVAAGHGVSRIYWYDAIDDGPDRTDNEDNFGLFRAPTSLAPGVLVPKPAAGVAAVASRAFTNEPVRVDRLAAAGRIARFGSDRALAWSAEGTTPVAVPSSLAVWSMTGRRMAAPDALGAQPIWLTGTGTVKTR